MRGAIAGAAGTTAMTAAQTAYYKATGSEPSSTPGEVGKRLVEGVLGREVPDERMEALNQGMHCLYGTSWGLPYSVVAGSRRSNGSILASGTTLALLVWVAGRGELAAMKLAPPPWKDPPQALAMDVGSHLVYGLATVTAFRILR